MRHPPPSPETVRAAVRRITGREARGIVGRQTIVESAARVQLFQAYYPNGHVFVRELEGGWNIFDPTDQREWTDVFDPKHDPDLSIFDYVVASDSMPLLPRFVTREKWPGNVRRYVCETVTGPMVLYIRPRKDIPGVQGVIEVPARLTFHGFLSEGDFVDRSKVEVTKSPPTWIAPFLLPAESVAQKHNTKSIDMEGSLSELESTFDAQRRGVYIVYATVAHYSYSFADAKKVYERYTVPVRKGNETVGWTFRREMSPRYEEIAALLVGEHERQHFRQLMSTPTGVLIWRCVNVIVSGIASFLENVKDAGGTIDRLPLSVWYQETGRDWLESTDPRLGRHLGRILDSISNIDVFWKALLGRPNITLGQFIDLANTAMAELVRVTRFPRPIRWTTHLDPEQPYLPTNLFSLKEVVEGAARTLELGLMSAAGYTKAIVDWRERAIFGVYKPAFAYLEHRLIQPSFMGITFDLALMAPIDLSCASAIEGTANVEDLHPGYRLSRLASAFEALFWPMYDPAAQKALLLDEVPSRAGLAPPRRVIEAALEAGFLAAEGREVGKVLERMATDMKRAFRARLQKLSVAYPLDGERAGLEPIIEYYDDRVAFNTQDYDLGFDTHWSLVYSRILLSLLGDGSIKDLRPTIDSFKAQIQRLPPESHRPRDWDLGAIAADALGPELAGLLKD